MIDIRYRVGHDGPNVSIGVVPSVGDSIIGLMPPAQAREFAASILSAAERAEIWEGITGEVRRDAFVKVGYVLPAKGQ